MDRRVARPSAASKRFKIWGVVYYAVGFGSRERKFGFCREYDPKTFRFTGEYRFTVTGGKAYNYAE